MENLRKIVRERKHSYFGCDVAFVRAVFWPILKKYRSAIVVTCAPRRSKHSKAWTNIHIVHTSRPIGWRVFFNADNDHLSRWKRWRFSGFIWGTFSSSSSASSNTSTTSTRTCSSFFFLLLLITVGFSVPVTDSFFFFFRDWSIESTSNFPVSACKSLSFIETIVSKYFIKITMMIFVCLSIFYHRRRGRGRRGLSLISSSAKSFFGSFRFIAWTWYTRLSHGISWRTTIKLRSW